MFARPWRPFHRFVSSWILLPSLGPLPESASDLGGAGWWVGPQEVDLADGLASIRIPPGCCLADPETAEGVLEALGNPPSGLEIGLVVPRAGSGAWQLVLEYEPSGPIDDTHPAIDSAALLREIRDATEAANRYRRKRGAGSLEVVGWAEPAYYDGARHRLVWAIVVRTDGGRYLVNACYRVLARAGFVIATGVFLLEHLAACRVEIEKLVSSLHCAGAAPGPAGSAARRAGDSRFTTLCAGETLAARLGPLPRCRHSVSRRRAAPDA